MKIAITGEGGFLGYHLTQYYKWVKEYEVISLGRDYMNNITLLKDCDLLVHCAGVNRGDDVYSGNVLLARDLINSLDKEGIKIDIKFTSSTQEGNNTPYGQSKREASKILNHYCDYVGTTFENYKLPNLFGVFGKPNYNSFINTFCYNVVNDIKVNYNQNEVELCYVYDAIKVMDNQIDEFPTTKIRVDEVYELISTFHKQYSAGVIPKLDTDFSRNLFNVYREFNPHRTSQNVRHTDDRGYLVELVKTNGTESQVFFSTTKPGITRGNHFHFGKVERFCVLSGDAKINMRRVGTTDVKSFNISGDDNVVVDMPVLYTHNITNVGITELVCIFWVDEIFDSENMDTYFVEV